MVQRAVPIADLVTHAEWTATPYFSKVDEGEPGDSVVIQNPTPATADIIGLDLSTVTDPAVSTGHVIRANFQKVSGTGVLRLTVQLRQGYVDEGTQGTLIATALFDEGDIGVFESYTLTLSGTEADSITDYSDLQFRVWASRDGGQVGRPIDVDFVEFEVPDAAGPQIIAVGTIAETDTLVTINPAGPIVTAVGTLAETESLVTVAPVLPEYDPDTWFAPPFLAVGFTSSAVTNIDEWPFSTADSISTSRPTGTQHTWGADFDLSNSPGDKKGFRVIFLVNSSNIAGFSFDEVELINLNGPTTLHLDTSPGLPNITTDTKHLVFEFPDSAFSGDPDIDNLGVRFRVTNLHTGNNDLTLSGIRLSKSPLTVAQEYVPPSALGDPDFVWYLPSHLSLLNLAVDDQFTVWPDASGGGRHLMIRQGSGAFLRASNRVEFTSSASRYISSRQSGDPVTGNHIWVLNLTAVDSGITQTFWTLALEFEGSAVPGDKNIGGIDDDPGTDRFLLMSGDGTGPVHIYGTHVVQFNTEYWITQWVRDAANELQWINDEASPDIDGASGSNDWLTWSFGMRESNERPFLGFVEEGGFGIIDGAGITETNIDNARDEWVNGPSNQIGAIDEIESLIGITPVKPIVTAVGVLAESESLITAQADKPIVGSVGLVTESDALISVVARKNIAVGILAESESLISAQAVKPIVQAIGLVTETNALIEASTIKAIDIGILAELESLVNVGALQPIIIPVGSLSTVDSLIDATAEKMIDVAIGLISETDSLVGVQAVKPIINGVGAVAEAETLNAVVAVKPVVTGVGLITELDSLLNISILKPIIEPIGVLTSVDSLIGVSSSKAIDVGVLATTETLNAIPAIKDIVGTVGQVSELETLLSVSAIKPIIEPVGVLAGSDSLIAVQAVKEILTDVGVIPEADVLVNIQALKIADIGVLAEVETLINTPPVGQQIVNIGILPSTDTLLSISAVKPIFETVGVVVETDSLIIVEASKPVVTNVTPLSQTDALIALTGRKTVSVGALVETESLIAVTVQIGGDQDVAVGLVTEIDALIVIQGLKPIIEAIGVLEEVNNPIALTGRKTIDLGTVSEINTLIQIGALKPIIRAVGGISETDSLVEILAESVVIAALVETNTLIGIPSVQATSVTVLAEAETLIDVGALFGAVIETILKQRTYRDGDREFVNANRTYRAATRTY